MLVEAGIKLLAKVPFNCLLAGQFSEFITFIVGTRWNPSGKLQPSELMRNSFGNSSGGRVSEFLGRILGDLLRLDF